MLPDTERDWNTGLNKDDKYADSILRGAVFFCTIIA